MTEPSSLDDDPRDYYDQLDDAKLIASHLMLCHELDTAEATVKNLRTRVAAIEYIRAKRQAHKERSMP